METVQIKPYERGKGLTANQLKLIAILAMTIDHIASLFVHYESIFGLAMHFVGRITGPTMFFLAAAGYQYTRNHKRYLARLALFAAISYLPFVFCFSGELIPTRESMFDLNVIYTIFIGVLAIHIRRSKLHGVWKGLLILLMYVLSTFGDWSTMCISMMLVFDLFQGDFKKQFWGYLAVVFIQGGLLDVITYPLFMFKFGEAIDLSVYWFYASSFGMLLPAFLLSRYNGERGRGGVIAKWGFYIYYPLHLLVLGILYTVLFH